MLRRLLSRLLLDPILPLDAPMPRSSAGLRWFSLALFVVSMLGLMSVDPASIPGSASHYVSVPWVLFVMVMMMLSDLFAKVATFDQPVYFEFSVVIRVAALVWAGFDPLLILGLAVARALMTLRIFIRNSMPGSDGFWIALYQLASGLPETAVMAILAVYLPQILHLHAVLELFVVAAVLNLALLAFDYLWLRVFILLGGGTDASDVDDGGAEGSGLLELRTLLFNVPLIVLGVIGIQESQWLIGTLIAPAVMLSIMVTPAEQLAQARHRLGIDTLTGIANRQRFWDLLEHRITRPQPFAVALLDIDNFKQLNDTYGHLDGDTALCAVARTLEESVRSSDLAARYGGEEFGIVLTDITRENAEAITERIRSACEQVLAQWGSSVSIGVYLPQQSEAQPAAAVVELADKALYDAKHSGKNRVVFSSTR